MKRASSLAGLLSLGLVVALLASGGLARAADDNAMRADNLANAALDVIGSRDPTPPDNYLVLMCPSNHAEALSKDSDIGAFIRHMQAVGSDLAVVALPSGGLDAGSTYTVYFKGGKAVGLVAVAASQEKPTDDVVAKAYVPLTAPVEKQKRRARYESGVIKADDGTEIFTLQIVGWQ